MRFAGFCVRHTGRRVRGAFTANACRTSAGARRYLGVQTFRLAASPLAAPLAGSRLGHQRTTRHVPTKIRLQMPNATIPLTAALGDHRCINRTTAKRDRARGGEGEAPFVRTRAKLAKDEGSCRHGRGLLGDDPRQGVCMRRASRDCVAARRGVVPRRRKREDDGGWGRDTGRLFHRGRPAET